MINSTLCYITRGDDVLMLHRVKKQNDINKDKWIGIGGKFEGEESPDECLLREAKEETGLTVKHPKLCGIKQFPIDGGRYLVFFFKTPTQKLKMLTFASCCAACRAQQVGKVVKDLAKQNPPHPQCGVGSVLFYSSFGS